MEHEVNQMSKKGGWQEQGKASHSSFWIRQEAYVEGHHEKVGKRAVLAHGQVVSGVSKCPAPQGMSQQPQQVKRAVASGRSHNLVIASVAPAVFPNIPRAMSKGGTCGRGKEM